MKELCFGLALGTMLGVLLANPKGVDNIKQVCTDTAKNVKKLKEKLSEE